MGDDHAATKHIPTLRYGNCSRKLALINILSIIIVNTQAMTATLSPSFPTQPVPIPILRRRERILVVDDEPYISRYIEKCLRNSGFDEIIFSTNGSNVLSLALTERPQLIIMDVMMPGGNGLK